MSCLTSLIFQPLSGLCCPPWSVEIRFSYMYASMSSVLSSHKTFSECGPIAQSAHLRASVAPLLRHGGMLPQHWFLVPSIRLRCMKDWHLVVLEWPYSEIAIGFDIKTYLFLFIRDLHRYTCFGLAPRLLSLCMSVFWVMTYRSRE